MKQVSGEGSAASNRRNEGAASEIGSASGRGRVPMTRPPPCGRCVPYAPGVVGQMKVLQFAKNVRESSLIISVAE